MIDVEAVVEAKCTVTESPVWVPSRRQVIFTDLSDLAIGRLIGFNVDDGSTIEWKLPERVSSFGVCTSGRLVVALLRRVVYFDLETSEVTPLSGELDEAPANHFNDGKVGPDGCFWVGSRDGRRDQGRVPDGNGSVFRVDATGRLERKSTGYATSNGLAWTPDGRTMFHSDSHNGMAETWDFDPGTGAMSGHREWVRMVDGEGRPDGAACDRDGAYWSAGVSAGCLNKFSPSGELLDKLELPCPAPTMPCFAEGHLYLTVLFREGPVDPDRFPLNFAGLIRFPAPVPGAEVAQFVDE